MEDAIFVVIYRTRNAITSTGKKWRPEANGVFEGPRAEWMAANYVECLDSQSDTFEHAVVRGPIVSPETMTEAEQRLGQF